MERYDKVFEQLRRYFWMNKAVTDSIYNFMATGNKSYLARINTKKDDPRWVWEQLAGALPSPTEITDEDRLVLQGIAIHRCWQVIGSWIERLVTKEKPGDDSCKDVADELASLKIPSANILQALALSRCDLSRKGAPTSAGRMILSLSDRDLRFLVQEVSAQSIGGGLGLQSILVLLLDFAPDRVPVILDDVLRPKNRCSISGVCRELLKRGGETYEARVAQTFRSEKDSNEKFWIGTHLAEYNFQKYGVEVVKAARESLAGSGYNNAHGAVGAWLVDHLGELALPEMVAYMKRSSDYPHYQQTILSHCVDKFGTGAVEIVLAAINAKDFDLSLEAFGYLVSLDDGTHRDLIQSRFSYAFRNLADPQTLIRYLGIASKCDPSLIEPELWLLVERQSKPVRESAARMLGRLGDSIIPGIEKMLCSKSADTRMTAVIALTAADTPAAHALLERQVEREDADDVREAILAGLQKVWAAAGKQLTKEDVEYRASQYESKMKWPPAKWLANVTLPALYYVDGSPVPEGAVRYMLSRQSRCADIRPLIELKPLFDMIDRRTSGDFGMQILQGFLSSGAEAKDRWALTVAGSLGDDRIVPVLNAQIREWADGSRGKLAEYAVQALALLASDRALLAIDSLAMRYRTKMKNVGAAAVEAFNNAAESLGVTPEELGDRVVPRLGFDEGNRRLIECGGKKIAVTIGPDFKFRYHDLESNKKTTSLPSNAPRELKEEFKELNATLREVVKAQTLRLENLMVRQHKWPAARWKELFLSHPLLVPFGIRLVWGVYRDGGLQNTLRVMEDGTLTDRNDEETHLPDDSMLGIVHPLELDDDVVQEWMKHLMDYEITSPFPQMERPVVRPTPDQMDMTYYKDLSGTSLNGMTFKGRAERLGWRRGSVCDGGGITSYVKSFPGAGVDAFVLLEGMYIGIDMYSDIKLDDAFFVKFGSVITGSYTYDEPTDEKDKRLIPFCQVPPIVFSEVMGDLKRIAGQKEEE